MKTRPCETCPTMITGHPNKRFCVECVAGRHRVRDEKIPRPETRGACKHKKPCPFYTCKHHSIYFLLPYQINARTDEEIFELFDKLPKWASCTLDIADYYSTERSDNYEDYCDSEGRPHITLDNIGKLHPLGPVCRERVRQYLGFMRNVNGRDYWYGALPRMRHPSRANILEPFLTDPPDRDRMCGDVSWMGE